MSVTKDDLDHLHLAKFWAERRSKDPNTQVGAVLVRPDKSIASIGYNGFPSKMDDNEEAYADRDEKLRRIIHAEMNAMLVSHDRSLEGYTIYVWPLFPCNRCVVHIIQAGITRVVSIEKNKDSVWRESIEEGKKYMEEARVEYKAYTWGEFNAG